MCYIVDRLRNVKQGAKMKAKFYTASNGTWSIASGLDLNYIELRSWILSGGYIIVDSKKVSTVKELDEIFKTSFNS